MKPTSACSVVNCDDSWKMYTHPMSYVKREGPLCFSVCPFLHIATVSSCQRQMGTLLNMSRDRRVCRVWKWKAFHVAYARHFCFTYHLVIAKFDIWKLSLSSSKHRVNFTKLLHPHITLHYKGSLYNHGHFVTPNSSVQNVLKALQLPC